jgi:hypothetical protein
MTPAVCSGILMHDGLTGGGSRVGQSLSDSVRRHTIFLGGDHDCCPVQRRGDDGARVSGRLEPKATHLVGATARVLSVPPRHVYAALWRVGLLEVAA